jgi:small subunit ribosomal protein S26e
MVDASAKKDIQDASVYDEYTLPKFYMKVQYCVSCAIHAKVVRVRNVDVRKTRISTKKRISVPSSISFIG